MRPSLRNGSLFSASPRPDRPPALPIVAAAAVGLLLAFGPLVQQDACAQTSSAPPADEATIPTLETLVRTDTSAMIPVVERFTDDRNALRRRYDARAPERRERLRSFYTGWLNELEAMDFDRLGVQGRVDHVLLRNEIRSALHQLDQQGRRAAEMAPYLPFAPTITDLFYNWRDNPSIDPRAAADTLAALHDAIARTRDTLATDRAESSAERVVAHRAVERIDALRAHLKTWFEFYDGYHPEFSWWAEGPYEQVRAGLEDYATVLRQDVVGVPEDEEEPLIGDPIGADALERELRYEMIPYSPEELISFAKQELAWGKEQMRRAAREMGYGDDWQAALEAVKTNHVEPGQQPELAHELAEEAVAFLRERDLVTVPPMAEEMWRMQMLSPEWQRVAPYFLGGEVVRVAFPKREMSHENKLMSIRGNNRHFSRAVVHHELIPGHHLQGFMTDRYNAHRELFSTPFWGEGWALYWEMRLWELDFPRSPEDRIGMLFWRNHRAARIIFSLRYHLGEMTAQEAVDFLVEEVGHERANAEAEVRRSIIGSYPPLYQAGYMLGGLQFRALHEEFVENGPMSDRAFHDRILKSGRMPVEMVRVLLRGESIPADYDADWRFYTGPPEE